MGAGGGRHQSVRPFQGRQTVLIGHRAAAAGHQGFPMAVGTQGYTDPGPRLLQNFRRQAAHLAVADDENVLIPQSAQLLFQNFPAALAHGGHAPAQVHFRFGPLSGSHRPAEQRRQHPVRRGLLLGQLHGNPDLGDDLILPQNLGLEAAGHLHQVLCRVLPHPGGKVGLQKPLGGSGAPAQQPPGAHLRIAAEIDFRPVAGGQQHGAGYPGLLFQPAQQIQNLLPGKGQLFPQLHAGPVTVQAGHQKAHFPSSFTITSEK